MRWLILILLSVFLLLSASVATDSYRNGYRVAIQRGETRRQTDDACVKNNTPGWCYPALPWYDETGKKLSPSLDSNGRLLSITNHEGKKLALRYDTFGRLTSPDLYDASGDVLATDAS